MTAASYIAKGDAQKNFFAGYSIPRNKTLMRIFRDLEIVEYLGSGMPRILKAYNRDSYEFSSCFVRTVFPMHSLALSKKRQNKKNIGGSIGSSIGGSMNLTKRQKEILVLLEKDTKLSYRSIANKLNINNSAAQKHLNNLKEKGILTRIGGTRGYWKVTITGSKG